MMKPVICSLAAVALLSSCATVKLTEQGEKVRVLDPSEVASCKNMGRTSASVTAKFIFDRPESAVKKELEAIARNGAGRMGGDTIVPLTIIENGQQTFEVFKCVNPDG